MAPGDLAKDDSFARARWGDEHESLAVGRDLALDGGNAINLITAKLDVVWFCAHWLLSRDRAAPSSRSACGAAFGLLSVDLPRPALRHRLPSARSRTR